VTPLCVEGVIVRVPVCADVAAALMLVVASALVATFVITLEVVCKAFEKAGESALSAVA
jgi:hypothetical protein